MGCAFFSHQFVGNRPGIVRLEHLQAFEFQFHQLSADFHLRGAARGKNQVADVTTALEHGGDQLRYAKGLLLRLGDGFRRCGSDSCSGTHGCSARWNLNAA